jgi:hypothetical protein
LSMPIRGAFRAVCGNRSCPVCLVMVWD